MGKTLDGGKVWCWNIFEVKMPFEVGEIPGTIAWSNTASVSTSPWEFFPIVVLPGQSDLVTHGCHKACPRFDLSVQ